MRAKSITAINNHQPLLDMSSTAPSQGFSKSLMNRHSIRHVTAIVATLSILITGTLSPPTYAGTYEAVCGTAECTIILDEKQIVTPYGVIPVTRVANWGGSGSSSTDLIMGAAATYLLGPVGLLGFLAKTHDYNYAITGYDTNGDRVSVQIRFVNSTPAKQFVVEMLQITGLGMGQTRTATQIKELEIRMAAEGAKSIQGLRAYSLDESLKSESQSQYSTRNGPKSKTRTCWSQFLADNPEIKKWAEVNKGAASKLKTTYRDC
jgi:hypothetical protein